MAGKIQNEDIKSEAELVGAGADRSKLPHTNKVYIPDFNADRTLSEAILNFDLGSGDSPLRMYAATPSDSKLYFRGSSFKAIDGTGKTMSPIKGVISSFPDSSIDFQSGVTTGADFLYNDLPLAFPTTTVGNFRRFAFALQDNDTVSVGVSGEEANLIDLMSAGSILGSLGGLAIGYIDLEATTSTTFKTAGSTTDIIEPSVGGDSRIFWFGSAGGGAGGGGLNYVAVNSNYTASVDERISADADSGPFTITMPADPDEGDQVEIFDPWKTNGWFTNNVTVNGNGKNIMGDPTLVLDDNGALVRLIYNGVQWRVYT